MWWSKSEGVLCKSGWVMLVSAALLGGCGGGGESASSTPGGAGSSNLQSVSATPGNDAEANRFLTQATFGPTAAEVARVKAIGYERWIDEQLAAPLQNSHLATVEASSASLGTDQPRIDDVVYSWWTHAVADPAQLRQRVAFALSEIYVVSATNAELEIDGRMVASYMDMLTQKIDGNYRDLLEGVALHPAMGAFLSHRSSRREDPGTGRIADENFAREVMQLFSIGLYELNDDGTQKLLNGLPQETYNGDDVKGLAKVFTGWGWYLPPAKASVIWWHCFYRYELCQDSSQSITAMSPYTQEHSYSEKRFLGVTVPFQSTPNPQASLKAALDRLASHPNTAPFFAKQLIQRMVTSNPSPSYVQRVSAAFRASNGNIRATVKAVLLDTEARDMALRESAGFGKLREPLVRITHLLRALPHTSDTYSAARTGNRVPFYLASSTDDTVLGLGQTPMRAPSVFNFFRPGYKPPQTDLADQGLVAPEMQITSETSVLGYANYVAQMLEDGLGQYNYNTQRSDIRFDLSSFDALVDKPTADAPQQLITAVAQKILGGPPASELNALMLTGVGKMPNTTLADKRRRIKAAILMVAVSPQFIVQQ
ncbi:DUF1800 family protein [Aquabacterium sp. CECT 9606]|uniref:DUF1800 domain-containing protein n=1 Tax=Aquabacterium sp. CECT 9606 TaxID=2845822 RepID=UPI001E2C4524|nr:DUF1800 domain-containing protein [Aquabacterium sp. CECT 9606]